MTHPISEVARLPAPGDNVAIAIRRLEEGSTVEFEGATLQLSHGILEGHRFAVRTIEPGQMLASWGLPFGKATRRIDPGQYICNSKMLEALGVRHLDFALPAEPNFADASINFQLDEKTFRPVAQMEPAANPATFQGYARAGDRGAGTRNSIAVLGTSSRTGGYARLLAERFKDVPAKFPQIDGVVPVAHTEGGGPSRPNNLEFVLRTLAGFMVNPNIGAVLAVDLGTEPVTNQLLAQYMREHGYPLDQLEHRFFTMTGNYDTALAQGAEIIERWLPQINACRRTVQPLRHLKIGLQCGGSDAFSGVSGNPLAGWVTKEVVRHGGSANLAETSELIGAEPYVLERVRDFETAQRFIKALNRFQEWAGWHGHSAAGNPSGGNLYRGLYNISIKSIGAARKKDPQVRLDYVIEYSAAMTAPGFYFMDSPGNDLESVAGQVAAGCNLILFTTGNGSITNFPFVPTIKIVTTTGRFEMLRQEMDVNAGRYLDGLSMDELGAETFEHTRKIASGERSAGEKAGHSQVQLWREWRQTKPADIRATTSKPSGRPFTPAPARPTPDTRLPPLAPGRPTTFSAFATPRGYSSDQVALIVPTSLCSGQIARMIVEQLQRESLPGVTRCVALPHTEGCGASSGESEQLYLRTMTSYLCHPLVRRALLLEHGCEKTHNHEIQHFLEQLNIDHSAFGWASVQLDGGIEAVTAKVSAWFKESLGSAPAVKLDPAQLDSLRVGMMADGVLAPETAAAFARLAEHIVHAGGTVVLPQNSLLSSNPSISRELGLFQGAPGDVQPTLSYGEHFRLPGLHVMETPTDHHGEIITGLGATGVEIILCHVERHPLTPHPLVPLLQVGPSTASHDLDHLISPDVTANEVADQLLDLILRVAGREYRPRLVNRGLADFQVTRGLVGVSL